MPVAIDPLMEPMVVTATALSAGWNRTMSDAPARRLGGYLAKLNVKQTQYVCARMRDLGYTGGFLNEALLFADGPIPRVDVAVADVREERRQASTSKVIVGAALVGLGVLALVKLGK